MARRASTPPLRPGTISSRAAVLGPAERGRPASHSRGFRVTVPPAPLRRRMPRVTSGGKPDPRRETPRFHLCPHRLPRQKLLRALLPAPRSWGLARGRIAAPGRTQVRRALYTPALALEMPPGPQRPQLTPRSEERPSLDQRRLAAICRGEQLRLPHLAGPPRHRSARTPVE